MSHADEQQAHAAAHEAPAAAELPACPACGALARRAAARYCATCGRHLREREYSPADSLRASYRWPSIMPPPARHPPTHATAAAPLWRHGNELTARGYVFLAYALFPFVGLVFCVCAYVYCKAGLRDALACRREHAASEARRGMVYAVLLGGVQTFIWLVAFVLPLRMLS